jgi:hypothetical protein
MLTFTTCPAGGGGGGGGGGVPPELVGLEPPQAAMIAEAIPTRIRMMVTS